MRRRLTRTLRALATLRPGVQLKSPRFWVGILFLAAIISLRVSSLGRILSMDTLRQHHAELVAWVSENRLLASAIYVLCYIVTVAISLPGAAFLTLAGGLLFGALFGTVLTAVGATIGATAIFVFAKALFGERAFDRLGSEYPTMIGAIRENAWSYFLLLRLLPIFPFFLVNLAAAFVRMPLSTYLITTFFGILPGTLAYSLSGAGIGSLLDEGSDFSAASVFTPKIIAAILGLAGLSLAAIPFRKKFAPPREEGSPPSSPSIK